MSKSKNSLVLANIAAKPLWWLNPPLLMHSVGVVPVTRHICFNFCSLFCLKKWTELILTSKSRRYGINALSVLTLSEAKKTKKKTPDALYTTEKLVWLVFNKYSEKGSVWYVNSCCLIISHAHRLELMWTILLFKDWKCISFLNKFSFLPNFILIFTCIYRSQKASVGLSRK